MDIRRQVSYQVSLTEEEREVLFQARDLVKEIQLAADQMGAAGAMLIYDKAKSLCLEMDNFLEEYCF